MKSAVNSWYPEGALPVEAPDTSNPLADQLLQVFKNTSVPAGSQEISGIGLINANAAFQVLASQTAVLTGLAVEEGKVPSQEPFEVTINGKYFPTTEPPVVIFDDEELEILEGNTDTEIKAIVGPFAGNPELLVLTNAKTPGGSDGGLSNGLNFFSDGKIALNIIVEDLEIEFGDSYEFTFRVEGLPEPYADGIPEGETLNSVLTDLGLPVLPEIVLSSTATGPFPDVNFYAISPNFGEVVLSQEQTDAYQINLINGLLTINRKNLIVKPADLSIVYGESINVLLNYFGEDEETLDSDLEEAIRNAHNADFFKDDDPNTDDNTLLVINKLRAVVNSENILGLLNSGSSWMASEKIIQNKLRAVINGELNLVDLETQNFDNYFAAVDDPIGNKLRAVINKLRAVINGEDLLNGNIKLQLNPENEEEEAIPNKLRAVINSTSLLNQEGETGFGAYNKIFAVVDFEDGSPADENGDPIDPDDADLTRYMPLTY